jgi:hypothetical protein
LNQGIFLTTLRAFASKTAHFDATIDAFHALARTPIPLTRGIMDSKSMAKVEASSQESIFHRLSCKYIAVLAMGIRVVANILVNSIALSLPHCIN